MRGKQRQAQKAVTPQQVKMIHVLKQAIGMDEDQYRFALYEGYRVESSKELTLDQAEDLIRQFREKAVAAGVWEERPRAARHAGLKSRPGYASPAQLAFIGGLWRDVSRVPEEEQGKALRHFLQRVAGVSDLRFLTRGKVTGVLKALKEMKARKQEAGS